MYEARQAGHLQTPAAIVSITLAAVLSLSRSGAVTGAEPVEFPGHREVVYDAVYLPDGKSFVSASFDQTLKLWDVQSRQSLRTMEGHTGIVLAVAVSPDGSVIASGSSDRSIRLWDVPQREPHSIQDFKQKSVRAMAASQNRSQFATVEDGGRLKIWQIDADGKASASVDIAIDLEVHVLAWRRDSKQLAAGSTDGRIRLLNPTDGATLATFDAHQGIVTGLAFSSNSQQIFSSGKDGFVRRWPTSPQEEYKPQVEHQADDTSVNDLAMTSNGAQYATAGADGSIKLWNSSNSSPVRSFSGLTGEALCVSISPDNRQVAAGGEDNSVRTWDLNRATGSLLMSVPDQPSRISFSPDSKRLAVALADNSIQCFDPTAPNPRPAEPPGRDASQTLKGHTAAVTNLAWSADSQSISSSSGDGTIRHWAVANPRERGTMTGHSSQVYALAFSPDGTTLASASSDKTVRLWNLETRKQIRTVTSQPAPVYAVVFSPDGSQLAISTAENSVILLDAASGREVRRFEGPEHPVYSVSFSADGKTLAAAGMGVGTERPIFVWKTDASAPQTVLNGHPDDIYRVQFSGNGSRLLSIGYSGVVRIWDHSKGNTVFETAIGAVSYSARYSPDGTGLIVSSNDRTVRLIAVPESAR